MVRLRTTSDDMLRNIEESKEGDNEKVVRKQIVDWCRLSVYTLTEPLDRNEKIAALSRIIDEVKSGDKAP